MRKSTKFGLFTGFMAAAALTPVGWGMTVAWLALGAVGGTALRRRENSEEIGNIVKGLHPDTLKYLQDMYIRK